ncbi:MAG: MerR family transcriptional regulator [Prevotellaceae bacterium]|jgi:DNA-binding transcriptional MerR regulator|nr:MerR family transcriptional regulator [Prevotellaceae bacterium]
MEKLYYSISEVADLLAISKSKLRFWETEFPLLRPHRNEKGTRYYTAENIKLIKEIIFLKKQKLKNEGARQKLRDNKDDISKKQEITERLTAIRSELLEIAKHL